MILKNKIIYTLLLTLFFFSSCTIISTFAIPPQNLNNNVYFIYTADDLKAISENSKQGKTFDGYEIKLMNDINLNGYNFSPIGNYECEFNGTFDGNNHIIDYVKIPNKNDSYVGLFGKVGTNGVVKNLLLGKNSIIEGFTFIGGIVGYNNGNISNCYSAASVHSSFGCSAGIIGFNNYYGKVSNCKLLNSASVTCANEYFNPCNQLIGRNAGTIKDCGTFKFSIQN